MKTDRHHQDCNLTDDDHDTGSLSDSGCGTRCDECQLVTTCGPGRMGHTVSCRYGQRPGLSREDLDGLFTSKRTKTEEKRMQTDEPHDRRNHPMGPYRHHKGGRYLVVAVAETHQHCGDYDVVYVSLEHAKHVTRPLYRDSRDQDAWLDLVEWPDQVRRPRFIPEYQNVSEGLYGTGWRFEAKVKP